MRSIAPLLGAALLALCGASAAQSDSGSSGWQFVSSSDFSTPQKRHEAGCVEFGGRFFLMGGRGTRRVDRFDPVALTWSNLGDPPFEMHHFQPVLWGDDIYVVGGFTGPYPNETPIGNVWVFDPVTPGWTQGDAIPTARRRGSAAAVVYQDAIYVVGGNTQGHNGGYVPWLDRYDPATGTWTQLADAPHARDHFTAAVIGNKLYCAGGRQTEQPNPFVNTLGPVDVYDFTSGVWTSMPLPIPTERAGTMTVAREEHLIVVGGESTTEAHHETEALDVNTGEWIALPLLIQGRHSGGAVLYQDEVHIMAGSGSPGANPELNTQEKLPLGGLLTTSSLDLIANGDFDLGLAGWEDQGDLTLLADGSIAPNAIEVENGWAGFSTAGQGQEPYTLTCVYRLAGASGAAEIALDFLDGGGVVLNSATLSLADAVDWTSLVIKAASPAGTTTLRARLQATGGKTLDVDDVVLIETPMEVARLGVPANPLALLPTGTGPIAGQTWSVSVDHSTFAPGATLDVLGLGLLAVNLPTTIGTLLVNPTGAALASAPAGAVFPIPIPPIQSFVGAPLILQAASIDGFDTPLTNALDGTVQVP